MYGKPPSMPLTSASMPCQYSRAAAWLMFASAMVAVAVDGAVYSAGCFAMLYGEGGGVEWKGGRKGVVGAAGNLQNGKCGAFA